MMSLHDAARALAVHGARATGEGRFDSVGTDTRALAPGQLFVALRGERFDAHDFIADVQAAGGRIGEDVVRRLKIVPAKDAQQRNILTRLRREGMPTDDRIITQLIPLKYADPEEIKRLLTPLVSRNSSILSYEPTNMLIITDLASNIKRLLKILAAIDVAGIGQEVTVIPLQYADCTKFTALLNSVFNKAQTPGRPKAGKTVQFEADVISARTR